MDQLVALHVAAIDAASTAALSTRSEHGLLDCSVSGSICLQFGGHRVPPGSVGPVPAPTFLLCESKRSCLIAAWK
jgi:hypothetical protein